MPSPSTIAAAAEETNVVINDILELANDPAVASLAGLVELELVGIPAETPDAVVKLLESQAARIEGLDAANLRLGHMYIDEVMAAGEREEVVFDLSGALSELGRQRIEMQESRDRALAYNCDSVDEIRAGRRIAEAAARVHKAGVAYEKAETDMFVGFTDGIPDAVIQECADSNATLEQLLADAKLIEI